MEVKKYGDVNFICRAFSTRNGFAHEVEMHDANTGAQLGKARVNYLNRTWERFTFQTAMRRACRDYLDWKTETAINQWKEENHKARISKAQREIIRDSMIENADYKRIADVCTQIGD